MFLWQQSGSFKINYSWLCENGGGASFSFDWRQTIIINARTYSN